MCQPAVIHTQARRKVLTSGGYAQLLQLFFLFFCKKVGETPSNWTPMKKSENLQMVPLNAATKEYNDVETKFQSSIGSVVQIVEVIIVYNKICCASHSYSGFDLNCGPLTAAS